VGVPSPTETVPCATCGFHPEFVTPSDAAVALRSYPRRYRAALVRLDDEEGADIVRRPGPDGWSALDHAVHVARAFDADADALRRVGIVEDPSVAVEPERRAEEAGPVDDVLARLAAAAAAAADAVEHTRGKDWHRAGSVEGGARVSALALARHAVHEGVHHLRLAEQAIDAALANPTLS
jgi:DinB superfamily